MPLEPSQPDPFNRCSISDAFIKSCRCFNAENTDGAYAWAKEIVRLAGKNHWLNAREEQYIFTILSDWNPQDNEEESQ